MANLKRDVAGDFLPVKAKIVLFHSGKERLQMCSSCGHVFGFQSLKNENKNS